MGKLHDTWKKAKTQAKAKGIDTDGLFKGKLGETLDKFEETWGKLKPTLETKHKAKTLTSAEHKAAVGTLDPLMTKVTETAFKYNDALLKLGAKFNEKEKKTSDQKEKAKIVAAKAEIKALITLLNLTIVPAAQEHCRLYLKKLTPS